uniref:5-oxoprolinase (ATP-hydrolysing) n=1 Tax=Candidatus Kentrum sp. TC TaxID=2126339 RepID=A0A450Z5V5_9GAMM|nr:MAG: 5-oxoprolinase (ATP-hydrolysing) [Candidatus Kentron sp. TC]
MTQGGTEQLCSYTGVFTGTSPQQSTNFNAPFSVCRAAMLYVFRTLVRREPILLDEGCPRPIDIRALKGSLLRPEYPAAVAAGNLETSQCIALRQPTLSAL